jgi:hypothetical protein
MPHRLEYLIDKPFTFEEDCAVARALAARLDRAGESGWGICDSPPEPAPQI